MYGTVAEHKLGAPRVHAADGQASTSITAIPNCMGVVTWDWIVHVDGPVGVEAVVIGSRRQPQTIAPE